MQVTAEAPGAHDKVDRWRRQLIQTDGNFAIFQHALIRLQNRCQNLLNLINIRIVRDADNKFITTRGLTREVNNIAGDNLAVRNHHNFTVDGTHGGGENLHVQHGTGHAAQIDILTRTERAEHDQQNPRRQVRERALQRQTNGQTGGTEHGDNRSGLHAHATQRGNQRKSNDRIAHQRRKEVRHGGINFTRQHQAIDGIRDNARGNHPHNDYRDCRNDIDRIAQQ